MSNNTVIQKPDTPGDVISTEDIAGVKLPRSKISLGVSGTDDGNVSSTNPMPVSFPSGVAVNNFPSSQAVTVSNFPSSQAVTVSNFPGTQTVSGSVSVSNLPATQAVLAGGYTTVPTASKTRPANATAYAIGQVVAESTSAATVWTFTNCVRANGGTGTLLGVLLTDSAKQGTLPQFNLWLFNASPTVQNDAAAFAPSTADLAKVVAVVNLSSFTAGNANGVLQATELNRPFKCGASTTSLFGVLVAANAYTPVSGEAFGITLMIGED